MRRHSDSNDVLAISEGELLGLTNDLRDAHYETLPAMQGVISSWAGGTEDDDPSSGLSRRKFLMSGGLLAAGGLALASTGASGASLVARRQTAVSLRTSTAPSTDVVVSALAASLENLAVSTYQAALTAAGAGKLGTVPKAIATFVETAMGQHSDHAKAWNAIVYASGYKNITAPNAKLKPTIDTAFAKVTNVAGVAKLALSLEEIAAATYLEAIEVVSGSLAIETAATIQPVEMQHAAILNFVLGNYPVPASFSTLTNAAPAKDAPSVVKR